jgi:hypothetical protein
MISDHSDRSSNHRSSHATLTGSSNVDESGEKREREKKKAGKRPSRRRSHSAEPNGKYLPMMQRISTIKPSTEEKKKKKDDISSMEEKNSSHSEEGRPRPRSSSLPSDETENKSQRHSCSESFSAENRKRSHKVPVQEKLQMNARIAILVQKRICRKLQVYHYQVAAKQKRKFVARAER